MAALTMSPMEMGTTLSAGLKERNMPSKYELL